MPTESVFTESCAYGYWIIVVDIAGTETKKSKRLLPFLPQAEEIIAR